MLIDDVMSVQEAADVLALQPRAVRLLAASGDLAAVKRGRSWWIDRRAVERRGRQRPARGRPLSAAMAWSVLELASGAPVPPSLVSHEHFAARASSWLTNHPLAENASPLRARADPERFDAHPSEIPRILGRVDVMRTGISAADIAGLHGGAKAIEIYAPAHIREQLIDEHALRPVQDGAVIIRWVYDDIWPAIADDIAPRAAVLVDLLEHDDPRARREARQLLSA